MDIIIKDEDVKKSAKANNEEMFVQSVVVVYMHWLVQEH